MAAHQPPSEVVPYGSAYGLDHAFAQERLKAGAIIALDHAFAAYREFATAYSIRDLAETHADPATRNALRGLRLVDAEDEILWVTEELPEIYKERYKTFGFLRNWIVTMTTVGWKLAQPKRYPLSNVAEELALHLIIQEALSGVELSEADQEVQETASEALKDIYDYACEDTDFESLYELEDSDEIADLDPQKLMGLTELRFKHWFEPFGSGVDRGVPHPFVLDE
jgi:hypothetical protein